MDFSDPSRTVTLAAGATVTVDFTGAAGTTFSATLAQPAVFNNADLLLSQISSSTEANDAAGFLWRGGDVTVTHLPVLCSGNTVTTISATFFGVNRTDDPAVFTRAAVGTVNSVDHPDLGLRFRIPPGWGVGEHEEEIWVRFAWELPGFPVVSELELESRDALALLRSVRFRPPPVEGDAEWWRARLAGQRIVRFSRCSSCAFRMGGSSSGPWRWRTIASTWMETSTSGIRRPVEAVDGVGCGPLHGRLPSRSPSTVKSTSRPSGSRANRKWAGAPTWSSRARR